MALKDILPSKIRGTRYGEAAGSLLAAKDKADKKDIAVTLGLDFVQNFINNTGDKLKLIKEQQIQNLADNWDDIKTELQGVWKAGENSRKAVADAEYMGEDNYLNNKVRTLINLDSEFQSHNITYDRRSEIADPELRKKVFDTINKYKEREAKKLAEYKMDPTLNFDTVDQFLEPSRNALVAARNRIKYDPTTRGAVPFLAERAKETINKIFTPNKDKRQGIFSLNATKWDLVEEAKRAKSDEEIFLKNVYEDKKLLSDNYSYIPIEDKGQIKRDFPAISAVTTRKNNFAKFIEDQHKKNENKDDKDKFRINVNFTSQDDTDNVRTVNLLNLVNEPKDTNFVVIKNGERVSIPADEFLTEVAKYSVMSDTARRKGGKEPLFSIEENLKNVIKLLETEGRFVYSGEQWRTEEAGYKAPRIQNFVLGELPNTLMFIAPSSQSSLDQDNLLDNIETGMNNTQISDESIMDDIISDPKLKFDPITLGEFFNDKDFRKLSVDDQQKSIQELKENFPNNIKDIDYIYKQSQDIETIDKDIKTIDKDTKRESNNQQVSEKRIEDMDMDELDSLVISERNKMVDEFWANVFSFPQRQQAESDLSYLKKYANNSSVNKNTLKKVLLKYNLPEDISPNEVEVILKSIPNSESLLALTEVDSNSLPSLLARSKDTSN